MSLEPIKIPQNVYIEDRIIGPITLKQIILLGIGGGISYSMWSIVAQANGGSAPLPLTIVSCIPFAICAAFAFVKVNDLSLMRIGLLMLERMNKPTVRTFSPRRGFSIHIRTFDETPKKHGTAISAEKQQGYKRLDDLTAVLDSPFENLSAPKPSMAPSTDDDEIVVRDLTPAAPQPAEVPAAEAMPSRLPVNRNRIKANTIDGTEGEPRASVSLFRDISPR